jgi:hypothetical protein
MKKLVILAVVFALLVPATVMAATEFSLGGFIKLDTIWDSSNVDKNMVSKIFRNTDPINSHGRLRMTANASRINFTIKGPKLWGAQVTGYIEADWDAAGAAVPPNAAEAADTGAFRLRHAMFRLTWPETELMMGQYWSFFSEFSPESASDGSFCYRGSNVYRPAQIRVTQKFLGAYTAGLAVVTNRLGAGGGNALQEQSQTPHVEGKFAYEQDVYGKAAYYGKPRGLVAELVAGWQRSYYRRQAAAAINTWGQDGYTAIVNRQYDSIGAPRQYLNHWSVQGSLFIPVITTSSANLAGTASLLTQWAVGQGQFFVVGTWAADDMFYHFNGGQWKAQLTSAVRGFVQGQYYFTNEWFLNVVWGFVRNYGLGMDRESPGGAFSTAFPIAPVDGSNYDFTKYSNQIAGTLWFRPIQAIKFGLSYAYTQDHYIQRAGYNAAGAFVNAPASGNSRIADDHRVEFAGFFYF